MRRSKRNLHLAGIILLIAALALPACSFSRSSKGSSKSSSSPSRWSGASSRSSSGGGKAEAVQDQTYFQDVRTTTAAYASGGGDLAAFRRVLGRLAQSNGVSNWESDPGTLRAVGQGLASTSPRPDTAHLDALMEAFSAGNPTRRSEIQAGYASMP